MKPRTEELLYFLLWSAELLARPSFRNFTDSYEAWAYRNGILRQAGRLEQSRLLESRLNGADRLFRLTEAGRLHALGGRDPAIEWVRPWDGRWRLVLFDVPPDQDTHRDKLRRLLKSRCFGLLQRSGWITSNSLEGIRKELQSATINFKTLILL